jgi:hypothetical protein
VRAVRRDAVPGVPLDRRVPDRVDVVADVAHVRRVALLNTAGRPTGLVALEAPSTPIPCASAARPFCIIPCAALYYEPAFSAVFSRAADHRHRLLPARQKWPRSRCTAEQRDELASSHVEHGYFLPDAVSAPPTGPCSVFRTFSLPHINGQVLGADLNRSESSGVARRPIARNA